MVLKIRLQIKYYHFMSTLLVRGCSSIYNIIHFGCHLDHLSNSEFSIMLGVGQMITELQSQGSNGFSEIYYDKDKDLM